MTSIRKTKKYIRYACGDIAAELLIASHAVKGFKREAVGKIVGDIASLQVDALSKCSFSFDKVKADFENDKDYRSARHNYTSSAFGKLTEDMNLRMQKIVDAMNEAMPDKE